MAQGRAAIIEGDDGAIVIAQGADNDYAWRWSTYAAGADPSTATPVQFLTDGWTARAQLRPRPGAEPWLTLTTTVDADGSGVELDDDGWVKVHIDHLTTEAEAWNSAAREKGVWDLELVQNPTDPNPLVVRFVMGAVTVSKDVTRV